MKKTLALLALTLSVSAFAQDRIILNSKSIRVNSSSAVLVRTAQTPDKVEVTFSVPMANSYCSDPRTDYIRQTCTRPENYYRTQTVCTDIPNAPTNNGPVGPNYHPPTAGTHRVCKDTLVLAGTRPVPYDCSYTRSWCAQYATNVSSSPDTVKIKFKNLPKLGGTEEDSFQVTANQRATDGENVVYDITTIQTVAPYTIQKKGILGYDSYVVEQK